MSRAKPFLYLLASCSIFALGNAVANAADQPPADTAVANSTIAQNGSAPVGGSTNTAQPQTNNARVDEIYVTAQRRRERVVDVPISVAVVSAAQLKRQQVTTLHDLDAVTPSLDILHQNGAIGGGAEIRGIGTDSADLGAVASVGIVVDQVGQGNTNISNIFDVSRIEVLKGPQGTLFGLTTSAGVINITTNAPDPTRYSGELHTRLAFSGFAGNESGDQLVQAVVNVPLSADSAVRVAASGELIQGPSRDVTNNKLNQDDHASIRARYLWKDGDQYTLNLISDASQDYQTDGGDAWITGLYAPEPESSQFASCGVTLGDGNRDFCAAQQYQSHTTTYGASAEGDDNLGPATLTSISSFRATTSNSDGQDIFGGDPLQLQVIVKGPQPGAVHLFSQEFRIASNPGTKLDYTVGAFASSQITDTLSDGQSIIFTPFPGGPHIPFVNSLSATNHITDDSAAMFGQTTYHATDRLSVITGARITSASLENRRYDPNQLSQTPPADPASTTRYSTLALSLKGGLQYQIGPSEMVYATISRGYKGAQIGLPPLPEQPYVVKPELPLDYELGYKRTLFGGLLLDANLFYENVKNYQTQSCYYNLTTHTTGCAEANISKVVAKGGELDLFGRLSDSINFSAGVTYQSTTYPSGFLASDFANTFNVGGRQIDQIPRIKGTFSGTYEHPLTDNYTGFVTLNATYKSHVDYSAASDPRTYFGAHSIEGIQVGATRLSDNLKVYAFVSNILNVHEPESLSSNAYNAGPGGTDAQYGPESYRQVGLDADWNF